MRIIPKLISFFKEKWLILLLSLFISIPVSFFFLKDVHYLNTTIEWEKLSRQSDIYFEYNGEARSVGFIQWETVLQVMGFDSDKTVFNQWNVGGRMSDLTEKSILIEDIDGDNLPDVSFLQIIGNELYLGVIPVNQRVNYYHKYFLDSIRFSSLDSKPIYYGEIKAYKKPGSESKNIAVNIFQGHAKYPRKLYIVDFQMDEVISSNTDGNGLSSLYIEDIDGDSLPEFFGQTPSPGNIQDISKVEFHDSSTYLMVFNENLEFEFPPVEFKTLFSRMNTISFPTDSGIYLLSSITDNSSPKTIFPTYLSDIRGNLVDSIFIGPSTVPNLIRKEASGIYAFSDNNDIYKITDFKSPEFLKKIKDFEARKLIFVEVSKNNGYFFQYNNMEIRIFDSNFNLADKFKNPFSEISKPRISNFGDNNIEEGKLLIQDAGHAILLNYKKNILWRLRFIIVSLFLVASFFLMNILAFLLSYQQNKMLEREKEITELRFNAVKNQLEPHFLFNSLNSIGHLLLTEERMKAYTYLESLSFLLRNAINNSSEIAVPLKDELLFTRKYLEIEKLRFEEKFDFHIYVDKSVDNEFPVPKMIMQLHSENAVKHGFLHMEKGGRIDIRVNIEADSLIIDIDDNGAGRTMQRTTTKNLGKGLKISEQMLELYQKVMKQNIVQEIIDKKNSSGEPIGTHVIIRISKK